MMSFSFPCSMGRSVRQRSGSYPRCCSCCLAACCLWPSRQPSLNTSRAGLRWSPCTLSSSPWLLLVLGTLWQVKSTTSDLMLRHSLDLVLWVMLIRLVNLCVCVCRWVRYWVHGLLQTSRVVLDSGWAGLLCCYPQYDWRLAESHLQENKRRGTIPSVSIFCFI